MKKIIGVFVIAMLAITVFISTKSVGATQNVDLASLTKVNTANAECLPPAFGNWWPGYCDFYEQKCWAIPGALPGEPSQCEPRGWGGE